MKAHATNAPPDLSDARSARRRRGFRPKGWKRGGHAISVARPHSARIGRGSQTVAGEGSGRPLREHAGTGTSAGNARSLPVDGVGGETRVTRSRTGHRGGRRSSWPRNLLQTGAVRYWLRRVSRLLAGVVIILTKPDGTQRKVVVAPDERIEIVQDKAAEKKPASPITPKEPATAAEVGVRAEPPPLEDWLKGRKILTVKQDGTAMYKTIQAAIDAQQTGEVVEILDQGPYVETLHWSNRVDCGLISRAGSIVQLREWLPSLGAPGKLRGHAMEVLSGCRVSGLTFVYERLPEGSWDAIVGYGWRSCCLENCVFFLTGSRTALPRLYGDDGARNVIRRNVFHGPLFVTSVLGGNSTGRFERIGGRDR